MSLDITRCCLFGKLSFISGDIAVGRIANAVVFDGEVFVLESFGGTEHGSCRRTVVDASNVNKSQRDENGRRTQGHSQPSRPSLRLQNARFCSSLLLGHPLYVDTSAMRT